MTIRVARLVVRAKEETNAGWTEYVNREAGGGVYRQVNPKLAVSYSADMAAGLNLVN
jgi:hypothetical protein